jgi:hypothetical protein
MGDRLICVGILASGPTRDNVGEIVDVPQATKSYAVLKELLALGKVYKAWTIDDCVDGVLARFDIVRLPGDPLGPEDIDETQASEANQEMS